MSLYFSLPRGVRILLGLVALLFLIYSRPEIMLKDIRAALNSVVTSDGASYMQWIGVPLGLELPEIDRPSSFMGLSQFSFHYPGSPLLKLPFAAAAGLGAKAFGGFPDVVAYFAAGLSSFVYFGLGIAFLFLLLRELKWDERSCLFGAIFMGLANPALVWSWSLMSHSEEFFASCGLVYFLFRNRPLPALFFFGLGCWIRPQFIVIGAAVAALLLPRLMEVWRARPVVLIALLLWALVPSLYSTLIFVGVGYGTTTSAATLVTADSLGTKLVRVLWFDAGLLWTAPLLFVALAAGAREWRRQSWVGWGALLAVSLIVFICISWGTSGLGGTLNWIPSNRYTVGAQVWALLFVLPIWPTLGRGWKKVLVSILAFQGLFQGYYVLLFGSSELAAVKTLVSGGGGSVLSFFKPLALPLIQGPLGLSLRFLTPNLAQLWTQAPVVLGVLESVLVTLATGLAVALVGGAIGPTRQWWRESH